MRIFGLEIGWASESKAQPNNTLTTTSSDGWFPIIREPWTGAWQRNKTQKRETVLAFHAVYACLTLIASDIAKCRIRLVEQDANGIWRETFAPAFSPVLTKPNRYQTRIQFFEQWMYSKLLYGNTYVLKEFDNRNVVSAMYVLDPSRTKPLVAPDGAVYYQLAMDNLSGIEDEQIVPASQIIHDRTSAVFHPLCGMSPIMACAKGAAQGLAIQNYSESLFANGSQPGGILTAPKPIGDDDAKRMKARWEQSYSGDNVGRVAILGGGLEYKSFAMNSVDAQLIEQLKWSASQVCSAFHVPEYKIVTASAPTYNNIEALDAQYYAQCLQKHFEDIELCLDEGLKLVNTPGHTYGVEFDLDDLIRMDTSTMVKTWGDGVRAGLVKPNEGRRKLNLPPVEGGDTPYLQNQNWALGALARRDTSETPPGDPAQQQIAHDANPPQQGDQQNQSIDDDQMEKVLGELTRQIVEVSAALA